MFKTAVGYFFLQLSITGLVVNVGVLFPLFRLRKKNDAQFAYVISIGAVYNNIFNCLINCCYFAPTVIASNYILSSTSNGFGPLFLTGLFQIYYYNSIFLMILMFSNRLIIVVFKKASFFSNQKVISFFIFSVVMSSVIVLMEHFIFPCCIFAMDYQNFGFTPINPRNQTDWITFYDVPTEILIFSITLLSYVVVLIKSWMIHRSVDKSHDSKFHQTVRARERSIAYQFLYISIFIMISYVVWRVAPKTFVKKKPEYNIIPPITFSFVSCLNGCVFMFVNEEVKNDLLKRIFKDNTVHSVAGINNVSQNPPNPPNPPTPQVYQPDYVI